MEPKEFLKLPLSEAILQVIKDVKQVRKKKIDINMANWMTSRTDPGNDWEGDVKPNHICSVCLGGACLLGRGINTPGRQNLTHAQRAQVPDSDTWSKLTTVFDKMRKTEYNDSFFIWYDDFAERKLQKDLNSLRDKHEWLVGYIYGKELTLMYKQLKELSNLLKSYGK